MSEVTKESIAAELTGAEYPFDVPADVAARAKEAGLLIIYGASEDLMEFEGAFRDELSCYDGGTAHLDRSGLLDRDQIDDSDDEAIADYVIRKRTARTVEALWSDGDYSWTYRTDIPHSTFDVVEDGEPYCRGIVIDTRDLPANATQQRNATGGEG